MAAIDPMPFSETSPMARIHTLALFLGLIGRGEHPGSRSAHPEWQRPGPRLKVLFLGDRGHHRPADRAAQINPVLAGRGIDGHLHRETERPEPRNPGPLRRPPHLRQHRTDHARPGKGPARLRRRRRRLRPAPLRLLLLPQFAQIHRPGRRPVPAARHRRIRHQDRRRRAPDHEGASSRSAPGTRPTSTASTTRRTATCSRSATRGARTSRGPGSGPRARAASSTRPTATTRGPGRTPAFTTWSSAASAGRRTKGDVFDSRRRVDVRPAAASPTTSRHVEIPNYLPGRQWGTQGEPIQQDAEPALARRSRCATWSSRAGFEPRLFAAEPEIYKPLCMTWDHRGRLWIAESTDYPNTKRRDGQGRDRITICEDTDGDGRADSFKVFAEGLNIPTSLLYRQRRRDRPPGARHAVPQGHRRRRPGRL